MKIDSNKIVVDPEFQRFVVGKNWNTNTHGNLMCKQRGNNVYLTWIILGESFSNLDIDHIDRDVYNNKKKNLRVVTRSANLLNHGKRNIVFSKSSFMVYVGRGNYVGRFPTYDEAAVAYDNVHAITHAQELKHTRHLNSHLTDDEFYYYYPCLIL